MDGAGDPVQGLVASERNRPKGSARRPPGAVNATIPGFSSRRWPAASSAKNTGNTRAVYTGWPSKDPHAPCASCHFMTFTGSQMATSGVWRSVPGRHHFAPERRWRLLLGAPAHLVSAMTEAMPGGGIEEQTGARVDEPLDTGSVCAAAMAPALLHCVCMKYRQPLSWSTPTMHSGAGRQSAKRGPWVFCDRHPKNTISLISSQRCRGEIACL